MGQVHVLLIEHDWRMGKLIRTNLEASGIHVMQAISARHGVELLCKGRPDVILVDLDRLDMDVAQLVGALPGNAARLVCMLSEPPDRQLLEQLGVSACLSKPFAASALLRHVRQALDQAAAEGNS